MKQTLKPYIIITAIGLLVMAIAVPYYAFHWGVKPCTEALTDAANCGDADLGGVGIIYIGLLIALFGVIGLCVRWAVGRLRRKK